ncbi:hypothetical protein HELRODRAFT_162326 [Helobdella robusta]|uniref:Uncharacterized protein n=1 Tax=Helobdella robusta TaxID=6412 RepID=T1ESI3_HELRO|nr:hypothetical protein HELRODRAFT_162326 [Helobdella robusta]ESN98865.1 hypothetical protein HELRODRAFT_162326 [Helobdella robusta]
MTGLNQTEFLITKIICTGALILEDCDISLIFYLGCRSASAGVMENCSFSECLKTREENQRSVNKFVESWQILTKNGRAPFPCFYDTQEHNNVIVKKTYTTSDVVHTMLWPSLVVLVCGIIFLRLEMTRRRLTLCGRQAPEDMNVPVTTATAVQQLADSSKSFSRKNSRDPLSYLNDIYNAKNIKFESENIRQAFPYHFRQTADSNNSSINNKHQGALNFLHFQKAQCSTTVEKHLHDPFVRHVKQKRSGMTSSSDSSTLCKSMPSLHRESCSIPINAMAMLIDQREILNPLLKNENSEEKDLSLLEHHKQSLKQFGQRSASVDKYTTGNLLLPV